MLTERAKPNSPAQILIVWDDDKDMIRMFTYVLEKDGHVVQSATSWDEGLTTCLRQPPDLMIVHRLLDEQNKGLEFCKQVRSEVALPNFPIIVGWADIGASNWKDGYQQAFDAGANACFGRVFDIADVIEQVWILLDNPSVTNLVDRQTLVLSLKTKVETIAKK
jgi:CheY-like chemotaxis protein